MNQIRVIMMLGLIHGIIAYVGHLNTDIKASGMDQGFLVVSLSQDIHTANTAILPSFKP